MKHRANRSRESVAVPTAWRDAEFAAQWAKDTFDDRVSESLFDVEDERAEVEIICHGMNHGAN